MQTDSYNPRHKDLLYLAEKLDAKFRLPMGIRIGWDGIIGLVPGVGDLITTSASFYILVRAAALGCPPSLVFRMGINILIESVVDIIPIFGNLFDFFWKSNLKNVKLVDQYMSQPVKTTWMARAVVFTYLIILAAIIVGFFILAAKVFEKAWELLTTHQPL